MGGNEIEYKKSLERLSTTYLMRQRRSVGGVCWYEEQKEGLGEEFLESFDKASQSILQHPSASRIRYKRKIRAFVVDRFPYLILYVVEKEDVNVISVFNTHRNPKIWRKRIR